MRISLIVVSAVFLISTICRGETVVSDRVYRAVGHKITAVYTGPDGPIGEFIHIDMLNKITGTTFSLYFQFERVSNSKSLRECVNLLEQLANTKRPFRVAVFAHVEKVPDGQSGPLIDVYKDTMGCQVNYDTQ